MNKYFKILFKLPFIFLNSIRVRKKSFLWMGSELIMNDVDKINLSKKAHFNLVVKNSPDNGLKIITLLNSIKYNSDLAKYFSKKLIEDFNLFESQLGQDCIVDALHKHKMNGVFVEIGVGEGKKISNTYFLEKYRNWSGVLCEPSVLFRNTITKQRKARLITDAIYNESGLSLKFAEVYGVEELSTLSCFRKSDSHIREDIKEYVVSTISFNDLYAKYLFGKSIDYLSIDTEGSEELILGGIDFNKIDIKIISVEHNYDEKKLKNISLLLGKYDYFELMPGVFEFDAIFLKRDFENFINI